MTAYTAEQRKSIVEEFKKRISDVLLPCHHEDHYIEKWLKARRYDIDASEKMYRESMLWRKRNKPEEVLDKFTPPEVLLKYYPDGICGRDNENRPIVIDLLGRMDLKGITKSIPKDEILKFIVWHTETLYKLFEEETKKTGKVVNQVVQILDLEGFGRKHLYIPGAELFIEMLKMIDNNYPETLYRTYLINTPMAFSFGYSIIKPFLSEDTKNKFVFLGSNWKRDLRREIGTDQYPIHWGGSMSDPDGNVYCQSKICIGGDVPEEYYKENLNQEKKENMKTVSVEHGSIHTVDVEVPWKSDIINWYFYTENKNIEFYIEYYSSKDQSSPNSTIEAVRTVNCHHIPESGNHICEHPGLYRFKFDNSKSWMTSKKLSYSIEVLGSKDEMERLGNIHGQDTSPQL